MKKTTKKENFMNIIEILRSVNRNDLIEVMEHEIEIIDKKANSGKLTKTQEENVNIKNLILQVLANMDKPLSITELLNTDDNLNKAVNGSNQRLSALMTQLKNSNKVIRTTEGKKAVFSLNTDIEE